LGALFALFSCFQSPAFAAHAKIRRLAESDRAPDKPRPAVCASQQQRVYVRASLFHDSSICLLHFKAAIRLTTSSSPVHVDCPRNIKTGLRAVATDPMPFLSDSSLPRMERVKSAYGGPEPIAIVGFSFELPGGCDTAETFWQTLLDRRNTATEAPEDRYSAESIFHPDAGRRGTVAFRGGHFLTRDISKFDAPFFSISDTEAAALDPQQRILLETTFRALENGKTSRWVPHAVMQANINPPQRAKFWIRWSGRILLSLLAVSPTTGSSSSSRMASSVPVTLPSASNRPCLPTG
jgi:hypothetical protein